MNNNDEVAEMFMQIIELPDEDKRKLYNKLKKGDLIEMLINNNNIINNMLNEKVCNYFQEQEPIVMSPIDENIN